MQRRVLLVVPLALVAAVAIVATATTVATDGSPPGNTPTPRAGPPETPAVRVCGNDRLLDGPARPPAGAVEVSTSDRLDEATAKHPPGTTFWLEPGEHHLGKGRYAQVTPKKGNTYIGAPGAVLDGKRHNRYAFTGHAASVTIEHLTIQHFGKRGGNGDEGVVNHNSASKWTLVGNTIRENAGAGVMIGSGNTLRENCLARNGQYGFNAYHADGVSDITLARNEIVGNNTDDWEERRPGCGCTGGGKFWEVDGADVRANWVHDNLGAGLWADTNNVGFAIERNYIADNDGEGLLYETSYNARITDNVFARNGLEKGPTNPGFPTAALYVSESGSDPRVPGRFSETFEIAGNVFVDNWSAVILWENADRFAGSPANTSTGAGTLVNRPKVTAETCNSRNIDEQPYYDDCRWKTQNVRVHDNEFRFDPDTVGDRCRASDACGYNGIFANWGTFPDWSPYTEQTVQDAITFDQGNRFFDNHYVGPWRFVVHEQGKRVNWATWQSAPYRQDRQSTIDPRPSASPTGD